MVMSLDALRQLTAPMFIVRRDDDGNVLTVGWSQEMLDIVPIKSGIDDARRQVLIEASKKNHPANWRSAYVSAAMAEGLSPNEEDL